LHSSSTTCIYLVIYVDDIITGNYKASIQQLKQCISLHFQTDLGPLKYFLGIVVAQSKIGVVITQQKYALNILEETGLLDCRPSDTPNCPNVKLLLVQGEPLKQHSKYRRLGGKLNYLTDKTLSLMLVWLANIQMLHVMTVGTL